MGGHSTSSSIMNDSMLDDINNVHNLNNYMVEHNIDSGDLYSDRALGTSVKAIHDFNAGTDLYQLQNLNTVNLQNL